MKLKPILFSTPMVQAILDGTKTQTRRIVKYNKKIDDPKIGFSMFTEESEFSVRGKHENGEYGESFFKMPICKGDILWVRETFCRMDGDYFYKASVKQPDSLQWKPSIFMPKKACRIFLECTNIRIERLHNISENDAEAEGVNKNCPFNEDVYQCLTCTGLKCRAEGEYWDYSDLTGECFPTNSAKESFDTLWTSINGKESWKANPFVWVYDFKQVELPNSFI